MLLDDRPYCTCSPPAPCTARRRRSTRRSGPRPSWFSRSPAPSARRPAPEGDPPRPPVKRSRARSAARPLASAASRGLLHPRRAPTGRPPATPAASSSAPRARFRSYAARASSSSATRPGLCAAPCGLGAEGRGEQPGDDGTHAAGRAGACRPRRGASNSSGGEAGGAADAEPRQYSALRRADESVLRRDPALGGRRRRAGGGSGCPGGADRHAGWKRDGMGAAASSSRATSGRRSGRPGTPRRYCAVATRSSNGGNEGERGA